LNRLLRALDEFTAASAALFLLLLTIHGLSSVGLQYFITYSRTTWVQTFQATLFGSQIDIALMLFCGGVLGLSLVALAARWPKRVGGGEGGTSEQFRVWGTRIARDFIIILILLTLEATVRWVTLPVWPAQPTGDWAWQIATLEGELFDVLGLVSPYVAVLLLIWWAVRYLARFGASAIESSGRAVRLVGLLRLPKAAIEGEKRGESVFSKHPYLVLLLTVALSVFASVYAYLPSLNPGRASVSVDVIFYKQWLGALDASGSTVQAVVDSFARVSGGDRPLTLLLMYALGGLGISNASVVQYIPVLLSPLSVVVVFFSVKSATGDAELSSLSSLVTSFSYLTMVGIYTGFFADWLALTASYGFMALFIRVCRRPSIINTTAAAGLSTAILLFHEYTWPPVAAAALLFAAYVYFGRREAPAIRNRLTLIAPLSVVLVTSALDIVKSYLLRLPGAFSTEANTVLTGFGTSAPPGIPQFINRWSNLNFAFHYLSAGFLSNAPLLVAALAVVLLVGARTDLIAFVLSMLVIASIPVLVGTSFIQLRAFYNLPLQLLLAYLLLLLLRVQGQNKTLARMTALLLILSQLASLFGSLWGIIPPG
jgi:hypothetical protein